MNDTTVAAIDFETAANFRASACAVGVSIPTGDGQAQSRSWLIRPPGNHYDPFNISIHGITPEDTENAPRIHEVWDEVAEFIGDRTLIAHNAAFDMSVLRKSFALRKVPVPHEYEYLCTYLLARSVWPKRWSYRLNDIIEDIGLDAAQHHDPAWDSYAALEVGDALARDLKVETLREVAAERGYSIGRLSPDPEMWDPCSGSARRSARNRSGRGTAWKTSDLEADPDALDEDHPLYGQRVVITGALPDGTSRREAYQRVVDIGGEVAGGVSKKVNILVVADLDVVGKDGKSGKLRKAIELAEGGASIELMDASEFLQLLGA